MYLAVRKSRGGANSAATTSTPGGEMAFIRIYRGTKTSCTVTPSHLSNAHIDCTARPAVVFRIAAKNEQGYGPATQIRWLQGERSVCAGVFASTCGCENIGVFMFMSILYYGQLIYITCFCCISPVDASKLKASSESKANSGEADQETKKR